VKLLWAVVAAGFLPAAVACSGTEPGGRPGATATGAAGRTATHEAERAPTGDAERTPTVPGLIDVPGATLKTGSGTLVEGGKGSYCWDRGLYRQCVDAVGPVTNVDPAPVKAGEHLEFEFAAGRPTRVLAGWALAPVPAPQPKASGRLWVPFSGAPGPVPEADASAGVDAPEEPGDYLLVVFAQWAGRGDISYGFYLRVK